MTGAHGAAGQGDAGRGEAGWDLLKGSTVIVTGAAGDGVAAGICDAVRASGGQLVLNDIDETALATALQRYPGAIGVVGDVSVPEDAERLVATATARFGPVTGLVNNAGVGLAKRFYQASPDQFDRLFAVDVRGMWLVSKSFAAALIDRSLPGAIVNVSSVHSRATMDHYALYSAAKAAVDGFTRGCAVELGHNAIRCNSIAPGYVDSRQNPGLLATLTSDPEGWVEHHRLVEQPLQRLVEPTDCGWLAVFLLSERSRSITGQTVYVDGGLSARLYNWGTFDLLGASPAPAGR